MDEVKLLTVGIAFYLFYFYLLKNKQALIKKGLRGVHYICVSRCMQTNLNLFGSSKAKCMWI